MKCPKCGYLGFEHADRCRNCGYDFSLSQAVRSPELALRHPGENDAPDDAGDDLALIDAAAPSGRSAGESSAADPTQEFARPSAPGSELPLFGEPTFEDD